MYICVKKYVYIYISIDTYIYIIYIYMYTCCIYTDIYGAIITGWSGCSDLFHLDRWGGAIPQMAELFRSVKCDNLLRSIGVRCCERFFFVFWEKTRMVLISVISTCRCTERLALSCN